MKYYSEKTIKRKQLDSIKCDICKEKTKVSHYKDWNEQKEHWHKDVTNNTAEIEIKMKIGTQYPECGWGEEIEYDLCPKVFFIEIDTVLEVFRRRTYLERVELLRSNT